LSQDRKNEPASDAPQKRRASFRQRYDQVEAHRARLIERLTKLGAASAQHPAYRRALKLLNEAFRDNSLAQRVAVLQAASWLIDVLEQLTLTL
jgi:hypothetical protein